MNVSATISGRDTGEGDFISSRRSRSTSKLVLPVPALAVTTTLRSKVLAAQRRASASPRMSASGM